MRTPTLFAKKVRRMKNRTVKVDYLARVEGEGAFFVRVKDKTVVEAQLKIFEPPRFFEAFLRGRKFSEAPDITESAPGDTNVVTALIKDRLKIISITERIPIFIFLFI